MLYEGLDDIRANFKSKEEETGGEVADEGERDILETPPVMGIFPDILKLLLLFFVCFLVMSAILIPSKSPSYLC